MCCRQYTSHGPMQSGARSRNWLKAALVNGLATSTPPGPLPMRQSSMVDRTGSELSRS